MKQIDFKSMDITNFLSFGKTQHIDFPSGIAAIFGVNHDKSNDSNGVGKSVLLSAVCFALYGDPVKNVKREEVVNRIAGGQCEVDLDFDVVENGVVTEYKICRGVKPTFCRLYENGKSISLSSISETTKKISEIIGTTAQMFKNTCLMTLEDNVSFARQKAAEKREFIEGVFDLGFIREMSKMAKSGADKVAAKVSEISVRIEETSNHIHAMKEDAEIFETRRKETIESQKKRMAGLIAKKDSVSSEIPTFDEDLYREMKTSVLTNRVLIKEAKDSLSGLNADISRINASIAEKRAECSSEKRRMDRHLKDINDYKEKCVELGIENPDLFFRTISDKSISEASEKVLQKKGEAISEIATIKGMISRIDSDIEKIKKSGDHCPTCGRPYPEEDIDRAKKEIEDMTEERGRLLAKLNAEEGNKNTLDAVIGRINAERTRYHTIKPMRDIVESFVPIDISGIEKDIEAMSNDVSEKMLEVSLYEKTVSDGERCIDDLMSKISEMDAVKAKIDAQKSVMLVVENEIRNLEKEIDSTENGENVFVERVKSAEVVLGEYRKKLAEENHMCDVYKMVRAVLSDDGFRSYMIKQYAAVLNKQINKYLSELDAPITMEFDEYLDDTIIDQMTGAACSYDSLSGGEKRRVDIACLLAFSDLRRFRGDAKFSHSFYDEILDSALSPGACEKLMGILSDRFHMDGESSMIITHKHEMQDDPNITKKILVEKIGGVSRISNG